VSPGRTFACASASCCVCSAAAIAADPRTEPHADPDVVTYAPPEPTAVSARNGSWTSLPQGLRGRQRATREGTVFFCNAGPTGDGYSLCLSCGRAEDQATGPHRPLVGGD
jgi:DEAD/DEAH box helicase domain-containing protein